MYDIFEGFCQDNKNKFVLVRKILFLIIQDCKFFLNNFFLENLIFDVWYGVRKFFLFFLLIISSIIRAEYEEKGGEYLKEYCVLNRYFFIFVLNK